MITYRDVGIQDLSAIKALYREQGWTAYLSDDMRLIRAFNGSLYARGAFDGEELIGFVRVLGDGAHTILVQDLIVKAAYRRKGIGKALLYAVFERFRTVRQRFVVTDARDDDALAFYRACGMTPLSDADMIALRN